MQNMIYKNNPISDEINLKKILFVSSGLYNNCLRMADILVRVVRIVLKHPKIRVILRSFHYINFFFVKNRVQCLVISY